MMNATDDEKVEKDRKKFEYVEDGICCLKPVFHSSERTTYLFYSTDLTMMKRHAAERKVARMAEVAKKYENLDEVTVSDFVSMKKNSLLKYKVKITVQKRLTSVDADETERMITDEMGPRCGFF